MYVKKLKEQSPHGSIGWRWSLCH